MFKIKFKVQVLHLFFSRFVEKKKVEKPDVVLGIHPGLHAEVGDPRS